MLEFKAFTHNQFTLGNHSEVEARASLARKELRESVILHYRVKRLAGNSWGGHFKYDLVEMETTPNGQAGRS